MRLTSDFWVSALIRRVFSAGGYAAVLSRGATEAGAVHIITRNRFGEATLYLPAPQTSYDAARPDERLFVVVDGLSAEEIDEKIEREQRFDPDVWVVELELSGQDIGELIEVRAAIP